MQIVDFVYTFLVIKLTYMLETVVFVLGKKETLVSKYHVFHHATLPLLIWAPANYFPGGHITFFGLINSITHIIVLGYFIVVTAFPKLKKYTTWWRSVFNWLHVRKAFHYKIVKFVLKFILQIAQFSILIVHGAQVFFSNPCGVPLFIMYPAVAYGFGLLALYVCSWL